MLIIAAISINSFTPDKIRKIILSGADVLRYNFAYASIEKNIERIKNAENIIGELSTHAKILIDMPKFKNRLGDFNNKIYVVKEGDELIFKTAQYSEDCTSFVPVQLSSLGKKTYVDQTITIGDGEISTQVLEIINEETIKVKILNNGTIQAMKGINIPKEYDTNELLKKYKLIFDRLKDTEIKIISIPFYNLKINEEILKIIPDQKKYKIAIKIEDKNGVEMIDDICKNPLYNMIIIDRGELGINLPYESLGLIQKDIIKKTKKNKKKIIVSTQILESTINNYIPSRSDILDLTNIVLDGADGIMLCKETGLGMRPSYTVSVAKKIIQFVETKIKNSIYENN